jgi:hypothetical protein
VRAVRLVYDFLGSASDKFAPRGQVTASGISGSFSNASSLFRQVGVAKTYSVTGGTYGWFGATGQVTVTRLNDKNEYSHMFELMYYKYKRN